MAQNNPFSYLTSLQANQALALRLNDTGNVHWTKAELNLSLNFLVAKLSVDDVTSRRFWNGILVRQSLHRYATIPILIYQSYGLLVRESTHGRNFLRSVLSVLFGAHSFRESILPSMNDVFLLRHILQILNAIKGQSNQTVNGFVDSLFKYAAYRNNPIPSRLGNRPFDPTKTVNLSRWRNKIVAIVLRGKPKATKFAVVFFRWGCHFVALRGHEINRRYERPMTPLYMKGAF